MNTGTAIDVSLGFVLVVAAALNYAAYRGNKRLKVAQDKAEVAAREMIAGLLKWQELLTALSNELREDDRMRAAQKLLKDKLG